MEIKLTNWRFDDGYPWGYPESYDADDWREPCWIGHMYGKGHLQYKMIMATQQNTVVEWLKENCTGFYDYAWRLNGGDPFLEVRIGKDIDATAFVLRWKE